MKQKRSYRDIMFKHLTNLHRFFSAFYKNHLKRKLCTFLGKSTKKDMVTIFLDIDGVIFYNPMDGMVQRRVEERFKGREHELPNPYPNIECDRAAVDLFSKSALHYLDKLVLNIIKETKKEVGVVLSSAWRENRSMLFLKDLFKQHSFSNYLIDKTPTLSCKPRSEEIKRWLSENQANYNLFSFVILDDYDNYLSRDFPEQFVKCEHTKLFGISEYEQALAIAVSGH